MTQFLTAITSLNELYKTIKIPRLLCRGEARLAPYDEFDSKPYV